MSPGEWDGAGWMDFVANVEGGGTSPASFLVMNDSAALYLGVKVQRTAVGSTSIAFEFDGNRNGVLDHGDDIVLLNPAVGFYDEVRWGEPPCPVGALCGLLDTSVGGTNDGEAAVRVNSGSFSFYELAHPLNSADDFHDFNLAPGDMVGFIMSLRFCSSGGCFDTYLPGPWFGRFGTLLLALEP